MKTFLKVERQAKITNRYNQAPYLTQNTSWESDKTTKKTQYTRVPSDSQGIGQRSCYNKDNVIFIRNALLKLGYENTNLSMEIYGKRFIQSIWVTHLIARQTFQCVTFITLSFHFLQLHDRNCKLSGSIQSSMTKCNISVHCEETMPGLITRLIWVFIGPSSHFVFVTM